MARTLSVIILTLEGTARSAVYGLEDLFHSANKILTELQNVPALHFDVHLLAAETLSRQPQGTLPHPELVIVPPILQGQAYLAPLPDVCRALRDWHGQGSVISSACAGAFVLAQAGLLEGRCATTHWQLEGLFRYHFPHLDLDTNALLLSDSDLVTAGGVMAWMDLALHLIGRYVPPSVVQALGRFLVVDTGTRQQRYYRSFMPVMSHGDAPVLRVQHQLHQHYQRRLAVRDMAAIAGLTERTFMRRFQRATGLRPGEYLQQQRLHKAREALENSRDPIERIAWQVGYEDVSAFRKMFLKQTGLSPSQYRERFGGGAP
ncbi:GlxA family transcriptional regulator [Marinobacterium weihaiense]|uniref:Helix-turn-helix domain-containing protein n=1 Tax=Marinobacterium weihaiense TaxID=2851016 RepID=A0ABS6MDL5_9GAMM|nr:helix-turn-helix domain-containing protein [Marinobacterium weihaiense]MBV0934315.1 helix-turn-helix domain-containing protein [Marinobacterium weihaiense]